MREYRKTRVVTKGRVIRPLHSGFDADLVVDSEPELLLAAEVMFRCLDGHMTEKKLNLVQFAAGEMAKARTCPSQVVRCQFADSRGLGCPLDDLPKHLGRHALAPDRS